MKSQHPGTGMEESERILIVFTFLGILFMLFFGLNSLRDGQYTHGIWVISFAGIAGLNYAVYRWRGDRLMLRNGVVVIMAVFLLSLVYTGGVDQTGPYWLYVLPLLAFYISGLRSGTIMVSIMLLVVIILLFLPLGALRIVDYPSTFKARYTGSLMLVSIMAYMLEYSRQHARKLLVEKMREIDIRNQEMETDLQMARELQFAMMPKSFPPFPGNSARENLRLGIHHRYLPYGAVGGDFFHIMPISETAAGLLICDVMGHEVRAALVTAMLRALAESHSKVAEDPGMLLTRINRDIFSMLQQTSEVMFATGLYMICDLSIPAVRFARAGHHEPLLLRPSVQSVAPIAFNKNDVQSALGLFENEQYHSQEFPIQPGDFILNFTDGLFEVTDVNNREFGMDNLCRTCEKHLALEPEAFLDSVLEEVCAFSSTGRFSDDVCILGLKVR